MEYSLRHSRHYGVAVVDDIIIREHDWLDKGSWNLASPKRAGANLQGSVNTAIDLGEWSDLGKQFACLFVDSVPVCALKHLASQTVDQELPQQRADVDIIKTALNPTYSHPLQESPSCEGGSEFSRQSSKIWGLSSLLITIFTMIKTW